MPHTRRGHAPILGAFAIALLSVPVSEPSLAQVPSGPGWPVPVEIRVPFPPTPVRAEDAWHLVYEIHVSNLGVTDLRLASVEVLEAESERSLQRQEGEEIGSILRIAGGAGSGGDPTSGAADLPAGRRAIVYVWLTVPKRSAIPRALTHRLAFEVPAGEAWGPAPRAVKGGRVVPSDAQAPALGPPLRGGRWWIADGLGNGTGPRRRLVPQGNVVIPRRFGADLVRLDESGLTDASRAAENRLHPSYGAEVLAVADGIVAAVMDGIPENRPGADRAVPITWKTAPGNHVILEIGSGLYALYAHLKPGSLRVRGGERVRRGRVLGLVGNSGDSSRPRLHFSVTDDPSPGAGEGLPFVLASFGIESREYRPGGTPDFAGDRVRKNEMPLQGQVIRFPE